MKMEPNVNNTFPNAEDFINKLVWFTMPTPGEESPFNTYRDEMVVILEQYGSLCAAHGAKSIRYKAIELVQEHFAQRFLTGEDENKLIKDIQNLQP